MRSGKILIRICVVHDNVKQKKTSEILRLKENVISSFAAPFSDNENQGLTLSLNERKS